MYVCTYVWGIDQKVIDYLLKQKKLKNLKFKPIILNVILKVSTCSSVNNWIPMSSFIVASKVKICKFCLSGGLVKWKHQVYWVHIHM